MVMPVSQVCSTNDMVHRIVLEFDDITNGAASSGCAFKQHSLCYSLDVTVARSSVVTASNDVLSVMVLHFRDSVFSSSISSTISLYTVMRSARCGGELYLRVVKQDLRHRVCPDLDGQLCFHHKFLQAV